MLKWDKTKAADILKTDNRKYMNKFLETLDTSITKEEEREANIEERRQRKRLQKEERIEKLKKIQKRGKAVGIVAKNKLSGIISEIKKKVKRNNKVAPLREEVYEKGLKKEQEKDRDNQQLLK